MLCICWFIYSYNICAAKLFNPFADEYVLSTATTWLLHRLLFRTYSSYVKIQWHITSWYYVLQTYQRIICLRFDLLLCYRYTPWLALQCQLDLNRCYNKYRTLTILNVFLIAFFYTEEENANTSVSYRNNRHLNIGTDILLHYYY